MQQLVVNLIYISSVIGNSAMFTKKKYNSNAIKRSLQAKGEISTL